MLGDAAVFAFGDLRLSEGVEERGLAVVHVAEEGDGGGAVFEVLVLDLAALLFETRDQGLLGLDLLHDLDLHLELTCEEDRGVLVDDRVDVDCAEAQLIEGHLEDLVRLDGERLGQLLDRDRLCDLDAAARVG